jgi:sulfite exporter TauE/SafE
MSLIPSITDPYVGAFAGGLFYGLALCTASCLPVVAGYIAGVGSGFRGSIKLTMIFNGGRVAAYALIGALIGLFGGLLTSILPEAALWPFQMYSSLAFGLVTIIIGIWIMLKARKPACSCSGQDTHKMAALTKRGRFGVDFGAFSLGFTRGLIICPPLILLLTTSLTLTSPAGSFAIAILFGVGTAISPMLLLGGVTGWLLSKAPLFRRWVSIAGGIFLIMLGAYTMVSSVIG